MVYFGRKQTDKNTNDIEQLEQEYKNLINWDYQDGENLTPYTLNGKQIYCYYIKDKTINLPNSGITELVSNVDEVLNNNIYVYGAFNDQHTNDRWVQVPITKRGDANTQINFGLSNDGKLLLLNWVLTGERQFRGYIYYTKKDN